MIPFHDRLRGAIDRAGGPVCVGLDPDPRRLPPHLEPGEAGLARFLREIIEATRDLAAAYKANTAFFEAYGQVGWAVLGGLRELLGPDTLLIADAKRGDVPHTNEAYARVVWGWVKADAVTVQPYLGGQALQPFCREADKGMFVLCATSNPGADEVQNLTVDGRPLYLEVARRAGGWSDHPNVGLVVGTTRPEAVEAVLEVAPDLPLLLPGGGHQGGDTPRVMAALKRSGTLGLFNFSRSVIYASAGEDFAEAARREVIRLREMLS